jgi:uncharacterized protein YndB with AHSA1/START domain
MVERTYLKVFLRRHLKYPPRARERWPTNGEGGSAMVQVEVATVLEHPVEAVFDAAADPEKQLVWDAKTLKSAEKLTPGPLGRGSRYRGNIKGMGVVEYEYSEFDRPHRFVHRASVKFGRSQHIFTFEPVPEGTRLTQQGRMQPKGAWRLMSPLMKLKLASRLKQVGDELSAYLGSPRA